MKIIHVSDTHGARGHSKLTIPECDVVVHTGDIGGRTSVRELVEFLVWFEKLPAKKKIFCAGNHDICLDKEFANRRKASPTLEQLARAEYAEAQEFIQQYNIVYLNDSEYVYDGIKFYGSPYSPSFHRQNWAFNADRGEEIIAIWDKIPKDVDVLLTHGPAYGILDEIDGRYMENGEYDIHVGCGDLLHYVKKELPNLKLHCFGHIHDNYGVRKIRVSSSRGVLFSNGAVLDNDYVQLIKEPLIIVI